MTKNVFFLFLSFIIAGCEKEKNGEISYQDHGYVIGFNPCEQYTGRVLTLHNSEDTVIAYNFPDSLYIFPRSFFSEYRQRYLFPDSVLEKYPVTLIYRNAIPSEKKYFPCLGSINTNFTKDVKDRQIIILQINKD